MKNQKSTKSDKAKQGYLVHSKVKPVVVKHVLKDQIIPLAE